MSSGSSHPYRQVTSSSSSATTATTTATTATTATTPYPLSDLNQTSQSDPSDSSPSMTEVNSGMEDLHLPPNQNNKPYIQHDSSESMPQYQYEPIPPPQHQYHYPQQYQQQQQQPQSQQHYARHASAPQHQHQQHHHHNHSHNHPTPQPQRQKYRSLLGGDDAADKQQRLSSLPTHLVPNISHSSSGNSSPRMAGQLSPTDQQFYQQEQPQQPQQVVPDPAVYDSPKIGVTEITSPPTAPYPIYDSTPSSPPSNPLSATSSVVNLNLNNNSNTNNIDHQIFSRSENNLSTPSVAVSTKYGHNRSVSSTSSFFYDRNDNSSMVDFNQNVIQQYLGSNSSNLLPRIKTLELYRKNAKKSNDPNVLFQYAQYMLQTALMLAVESANNTNINTATTNAPLSFSSESGDNTPINNRSIENSPRKPDTSSKDKDKHKKNKSIDFSTIEVEGNEKKLRKAFLKEAVFYLKKLSDKGYVEAQYLLGDAYSSGALDRIDNKDAFILFQAAAKHGHTESAYRTSYCYEEGLGTGRDARKAVEYLKIAASRNHPAAMYKLGVYSFYSRMGLPNDMNTKKMGIKWLTRATNVATELTAAAPFELGKLYYNGFKDIVLLDKKYALELYAQAASLGHTQSAAILGHHYEVGEIVPQDSNLSIHYYTQAALGGDPNSMLAMCAWYLVGSDPYLPKDDQEAFEWAKRAALCNLPKAQFALANFYDKGIGCTKDVKEAQHWYTKAAENGDEKSLTRLTDKELSAKIQKKLKKRPVVAHADGSAAQEKDCVIM
ncbi:CHS4 [Candida margitis]|uniref:CHS4 n=1 Tax=Candida margitis TaxID=1775924 RepID=UPI002227C121|nr:CHS4 [Candida margitis]KAI5969783.1 CHS4 [Candida margitis]